MLSHRLPAARGAALQPRWPSPPSPRAFTHHSQLLLVAARPPRPQLPYLTQPFPRHPRGQVARLLSTENRRFAREQLLLAAKWTAIGWTAVALLGIAWFGYNIEVDERTNPTPGEWRFGTRQGLRAARAFRDPATSGMAGDFVDWAKVGSSLLHVLARLEDAEHEGQGVSDVAGGQEVLLPAVGRRGLDVSGQSWPWRAGYFETVMGCAQAAEHLDGMVLDTTRGVVFPREVMIGPSNPDPRPVPPYMKAAPLEENCESPYPPPEAFYMRVLTGRGFTTGQKLDAALGYANWLEYKGLNDSAMEMYKSGVDIATAALPTGAQPADVLDTGSFTLKEGASPITPNLLRATTSLAVHLARTGDLSASLPILLSVLRARRTAPVSPLPEPVSSSSSSSSSGFDLWSFVFVPPKFPDPPPSGDTPLSRASSEPNCSDSELMLYIGEIIFASSSRSVLDARTAEDGLDWTKSAVTIADAQLAKPDVARATDKHKSEAERQKCQECLLTGVGNWEVMLQRLLDHVEPEEAKHSRWKFWDKSGSTDEDRQSRLEHDRRVVEQFRERVTRDGLRDQVIRARSQTGLWFG